MGDPSRKFLKLGSELILAGLTIGFITIAYLSLTLFYGVPEASGLFGHVLGVLGFVLMLMTEILYSLRKRARHRAWGRMSTWLKFHIYTGIVGPYLVFLHAAWKFQGLAGLTLVLTGIVVLSGFIGRYIYTAVPRTVEGLIVEERELRRDIHEAEERLRKAASLAGIEMSTQPMGTSTGATLIMGRGILNLRDSIRLRLRRRRLKGGVAEVVADVEELRVRRRELHRQAASLAAARRMLALWHRVHVPLGMTLFTFAIIHIGAAIYYATLLR
jgi:hypothetical protein